MGMISDEYYRKGYDEAKRLYDKDAELKETKAKLQEAVDELFILQKDLCYAHQTEFFGRVTEIIKKIKAK